MANITITYYGHACFQVEYEGNSVVFDPYEVDSVPGIQLPLDIEADMVFCSHQHADHNAEHLIHTNGIRPFNSFQVTVPHDDTNGSQRGFSNITFVKVGTITIVHMGDIGRMPTEEEFEALQKADVMMIPVGGHYTIDACTAQSIITKVGASLNIVMHYRNGGVGYDVIASLDDVKKEIPEIKDVHESSITFDETEVPHEVIAMGIKQ